MSKKRVLLLVVFLCLFSGCKSINQSNTTTLSIKTKSINLLSFMGDPVEIADEVVVEEILGIVNEDSAFQKVPKEDLLKGLCSLWVTFDDGTVIGLYEDEDYGYISDEVDEIASPCYYMPEGLRTKVLTLMAVASEESINQETKVVSEESPVIDVIIDEEESPLDIYTAALEEVLSQKDYPLTGSRTLSDGVDYYRDILSKPSVREKSTYYTGILSKQAYGYIIENRLVKDVYSLNSNQVVYVEDVGLEEWVKVHLIAEQPIELMFESEPTAEMMVKKNNFHKWIDNNTMSLSVISETDFTNLVFGYKNMVVTDDTSYNLFMEKEAKTVYLLEEPSSSSKIIGFALQGDRIKLLDDRQHVDETGQVWQLIEMIPYFWTNSVVGWVQEDHIKQMEKGDDPLQKVVLKDTLVYKGPGEESGLIEAYEIENYTKPLSNGEYFLVRAVTYDDQWSFVSDGINGMFSGYIKNEHLFSLIDEVEIGYYFVADQTVDSVLNGLKQQIIESEELTLYAEDLNQSIQLSSSQRAELAENLVHINKWLKADSSSTTKYYCEYPCIRLMFDEGDLYVQNHVILNADISSDNGYLFGIPDSYKSLIPVNEEFTELLYDYFPEIESIKESELAYLLQAKTLYMTGVDNFNYPETSSELEQLMGVRLAVRHLISNHLADEIEAPESEMEDVLTVHFVFEDGSEKHFDITNDYIYYEGRYFQAIDGMNYVNGLFDAGGL